MQRKEMIQMVVVIILIVAGFYACQAWIIPPSATPAPPANQPGTPPANQPPPEIRSTGPAAATTSTATEADKSRGFAPIGRADARQWSLANSRLTATVSDRGAVLDSVTFVDADGNVVFWRTPDNPTVEPGEPLQLLRPEEAAPDIAPFALLIDKNDDARNTSRWELVLNETGDSGVQSLTFRFPPSKGFEHDAESDGTVLYKKITLYPGEYRLDVNVRIENRSDKVREKFVGIWGPVGITNDGMRTAGEWSRVALYGSTDSKRFTSLEDSPTIPSLAEAVKERNEELGKTNAWITNRDLDEIEDPDRFLIAHGLRTQYFLAFIAQDPDVRDQRWSGAVLPIGTTAAISLTGPALVVPAAEAGKPGQQSVGMRLYAGPRDRDALSAAWLVEPPKDAELGAQWAELATSGFFDLIASPLIWFLRLLTNLVGAGFAIILLTLFVRFALSPLSYRGQKAMAVYTQKMKIVKPKMDAIKEKYKEKTDRDSQMRMLTETRAVMKEQNVGMLPIGGCLPMLIQLPIFIGLYRAFGAAFFLRQAKFLGIHDLSLPDATIPASTFIGEGWISFLAHNGWLTINILPMLWIALSILQFKMQPKPDDPQQAAMQKQMGCIFPLMGLMFYGFASGFAFYFIVSSMYSIAESKLIKRNLVKLGITPPPRKKGEAVKETDKPDYHGSK
ncbi:MAG: membrane protein insertase YidC [Planctomycetes bacterium]|nr:membrane protein insertase YidC [Planctomycetota bacterium]